MPFLDKEGLGIYNSLIDLKKLDKTTYEYNHEVTTDDLTKTIRIGQFPVGNSNITVEISLTGDGYAHHGILVISVQNRKVSYANLHGEYSQALLSRIYYKIGSDLDLCMILPSKTRATFHVQCVELDGDPKEMFTDVTSNLSGYQNPTSVTVQISKGGTGATTAEEARANLKITPDNIGASRSDHTHSNYAAKSHNHSASDINTGTLSSSRLPTIPVTKGGTGAITAADARANLGIKTQKVIITVDKLSSTGFYSLPVQTSCCIATISGVGFTEVGAQSGGAASILLTPEATVRVTPKWGRTSEGENTNTSIHIVLPESASTRMYYQVDIMYI